VAPPAAADEMRGLAADAWANKLHADKKDRDAAAHFREAAEAYAALAERAGSAPEKARWYRHSADRYVQAEDYPRALAALEQFRRVETDPEKLAEGWFAVARVYQARNEEANAAAAFRKCIEFPGTYAFRARLALAQADADHGKMDDAEEALKQNLELDLSSESETRKLTLFALADVLYKRAKYHPAALRYQEALDHHPADAKAVEARFHLADCYRQLAEMEIQNLGPQRPQLAQAQDVIRERHRRWLEMAMANYRKLADDLAARRATAPLGPQDEAILREAEYWQGDCLINLGRYPEAIRLYETMTVRYRCELDHLKALRQICRCYWMMREQDKARETIRHVRDVLVEMSTKPVLTSNRSAWQEWLDWLDWAEKH
jgi:tetratricopeptide (TPR) repeat protein